MGLDQDKERKVAPPVLGVGAGRVQYPPLGGVLSRRGFLPLLVLVPGVTCPCP